MEQNQNPSLFSLNLDAQNSYTLRNTASWAKVLGIASIITAVLCVILGIIVQQTMSKFGDYGDYRVRSSGLGANAFAKTGLIAYVILGIIYGLSGVFALNAGNKILAGLKTNDMATLNGGFAGARNFFALWSILMILFLLLILIGMLGSL